MRVQTAKAAVKAVDNVSFDIESGKALGLVGESGGGKSMTALSIMRLLPASARVVSGRIELRGCDLVGLDEAAMRRVRGNDVGIVFQDPMSSLNPTMTIGEQLVEAILVHRSMPRADAASKAVETLKMVGIPHPEERMRAYAHLLSGGMKQRVMIAMALACEPKLLIADEPTTALDVTIQAQILDLIDELRRRLRMAVLLVTHDLGIVAGRTDNVAVMYAGRIVEAAETDELFRAPRHPYTMALFNSMSSRSPSGIVRLHAIPGAPPDMAELPAGCRFAPRCSRADDVCRDAYPDLSGDPMHPVSCWHQLESVRDGGAAIAVASPGEPSHPPSGADNSSPILALDEVSKVFRVRTSGVLWERSGVLSAVDRVTLDVLPGTTLGVVGESGSGKTTLGRLIVGLEIPDSGRVLIDGRERFSTPRRQMRELRRSVQLVFQNTSAAVDPRMQSQAILEEPLIIQRLGSDAERRQRTIELMEEVGLARRHLDRYPRELSGGQLQRLGLARALAMRPRLVVADEPVSSLDVSIQAQVLNLMRDIQANHGLAYVFISHDLSVVRHVAHQVAVMYMGRVVEIGPSDAVYGAPAHPYTRALLDSIPEPDPARERARSRFPIKGEIPSPVSPPSGCRYRTRCPRAEDRCTIEQPLLRLSSSAGHAAACHFPLVEPLTEASISR